jgi:cell division protein FtsB
VFLDERPRERDRVGVGAEGGKDEYDLEIMRRTQFFSCTHDRNALLWHTVKRSSSARDAETPQPRKRRRTIQYLLLAGGCVLLIDALVGDKGLLAMMEARARYRTLEQSLAAARSENTRLREEARLLREDPATIEEIARRELGLIRPGEKLFILKDVEPRDRR